MHRSSAQTRELGFKIDELLVEEYKLLLGWASSTESILVAWERVFLVTNGFVFAACTTIAASSDKLPSPGAPALIGILAVSGVAISFFWLLLTSRTYEFIGARETRLAEIEKQLNDLHPTDVVFPIAERQKEKIRENESLPFTKRFSAIKIRRAYPILMIFLNIVVGSILVFTVVRGG